MLTETASDSKSILLANSVPFCANITLRSVAEEDPVRAYTLRVPSEGKVRVKLFFDEDFPPDFNLLSNF